MRLNLGVALLCAVFCATTLRAADLESILAKMDQNGSKFSSMTADLTRISYTKVLDEKSTESAVIKLRKQGRELQVLIDFTKPDAKTVGFRGRKAEVYFPKLNTVQEYDIGKHKGLIDQFLLVGFGTTGRDLKANYGVKYIGEEAIAGQKAYKLELIPSSPQMKDSFRRLELWISENGEYPVQQRFIQPSGDYHLATYSNVKLNPSLSERDLTLKVPKGVKREYPQK